MKQTKPNWWEKLSEDDRDFVYRGLEDANEVKVVPHSEVKKKMEHIVEQHTKSNG